MTQSAATLLAKELLDAVGGGFIAVTNRAGAVREVVDSSRLRAR
jgi:hypothetical protein